MVRSKQNCFLIARTAIMIILAVPALNIWAQTSLNLSGSGTKDDPYKIQNADDWNNLADYVAEDKNNSCDGLYFQMTDNIGTTENPITKPLGKQVGDNKLTDRNRFAGIFDGNNKTLTVNITNVNNPWFEHNKNYCAPFAYVENVTIKNLHVTGTITTTGQFASGLVGQSGPDNKIARGACTIENCHVSATFVGNTEGKGVYGNHGIFIAIAEGNATITNCWFDGALTGSNYYYSGGFIGLNKAVANLSNCLFNPSEITITNNNIGGSSEFVHNNIHNNNGGSCNLTNCYYTKSFSEPEDAQGTKVFSSYATGCIVADINAIDGKTYYIIKNNINWLNIQQAIAEATTTIDVTLPLDITAGSEDTPFVIPAGKTMSMDMKGFTIDRGLDIVAAQNNGFVIKVEAGASLTITDSSNDKTGVIKGGHNTENGGAIYNEGTLNISDITITGNYADMGGGIYINGGEITLNNVKVNGNKATTATGTSGSGIYLNNGILSLNNGSTITANTSNKDNESYGVGAYIAGGTINVSGKVTINNNKSTKGNTQQNIYLASGKTINVTGAVSGTKIGVTKQMDPSVSAAPITSGYGEYSHNDNFTSDVSDYFAVDNKNNDDEAWLITLNNGITDDITRLIKGEKVRYIRSFTKDVTSTICLPFPMTSVTSGKVYAFSDVSYDENESCWIATMIDTTPEGGTDDDINLVTPPTDANKPYLFVPDKTQKVTFSGTVGTDFDAIPGISVSSPDEGETWTFHGTYTNLEYDENGEKDLDGTVFGFAATAGTGGDDASVAAGEFVKAMNGATIPPFRAYLTYVGSDEALQAPTRGGVSTPAVPERIKVRLLGSDGTETAVGTINTRTGEVVIDKWYDMSGRELQGKPNDGGLYIHNGKSVIIR